MFYLLLLHSCVVCLLLLLLLLPSLCSQVRLLDFSDVFRGSSPKNKKTSAKLGHIRMQCRLSPCLSLSLYCWSLLGCHTRHGASQSQLQPWGAAMRHDFAWHSKFKTFSLAHKAGASCNGSERGGERQEGERKMGSSLQLALAENWRNIWVVRALLSARLHSKCLHCASSIVLGLFNKRNTCNVNLQHGARKWSKWNEQLNCAQTSTECKQIERGKCNWPAPKN